ncbi:unnamed protein product (macronuclear) [Paramecium tetraurelia]|uniref:Uncharacterized protein n=1 Tax=Paramecium tetraurelia TaxID=5888 RepID=A0DTM3_PARTE|nr:uncharacterized protein GSPATT00020071001 [Paramecium tetraurelia]CAK86390.1 unnamed protein product [Paramecium tetraurelia]|eukprot:XP_001453787.1 hypothetical protein (macronuclear) [Paramecium tetraurelia strain d4-2]
MNDLTRIQSEINQNSNESQNNDDNRLGVRKNNTFPYEQKIGIGQPQSCYDANQISNLPNQVNQTDQWTLLSQDENLTMIFKSINQQSIVLIYKQLQVQDLDTQIFFMNLAMSIIDSFSFFLFLGDTNQSLRMNKLVRNGTQLIELHKLFKKSDKDDQKNIILEYQINYFSSEIQLRHYIEKALQEIKLIVNLLQKQYNLIKKIEYDKNNDEFDKIISDFIQEMKKI